MLFEVEALPGLEPFVDAGIAPLERISDSANRSNSSVVTPGFTAYLSTISASATTLDAFAITAISSGVLRMIIVRCTAPAR